MTMMEHPRRQLVHPSGPKNIAAPDKPTDVQLNQFIAEHADRFTRPEIRAATAVMFLPQVEMKNVQVDEAELKKAYDFRKDALSQAETRSFVLIPVKTQQQAATAAATALKAGGDPNVVAQVRRQPRRVNVSTPSPRAPCPIPPSPTRPSPCRPATCRNRCTARSAGR